ncbi:unnamed protein product [Rotaria socialis]|uniref:HAT C-terminal dimerisation domain-containing protein n=1 Tax=Rotaria socialis TaxID=392032 RepID=A0A820VS24_9BILA|nr:unnamed protein product [Rotaria socialis]
MSNRATSSVVSKEVELKRKRKRSKAASKKQETRTDRIRQMDSDISPDEANEPMPIKRQKISLVHSYATKQSKTEYKCNHCNKVIRCGVGTNAIFRRHLARMNGVANIKSKSHTIRNGGQIDAVRKSIYHAAAIKAIVVDGRSFNDFRKKGMANFLSMIPPGYFGPHERTVQRSLEHLYSEKLCELQKKLKDIPWVSLTTDLWRRPKKHHYVCVTVHFVDKNYKNISKMLSFQRFHGRHFAKRIQIHLLRIVKKFGLQSKIIATTSDNGSDIRLATQQRHIFGMRLYCTAHGLNLTVKKGLGLWERKRENQKGTGISKRVFNTLATNEEQQEENTQEEEGQQEEEKYENDVDEQDEDEEEEEVLDETMQAVEDSNNAAASNFATQEIESDNEDCYEFPRDEADVISSDDETDESSEPSSSQGFIIEHVDALLARCRKLVNMINKSSILYETIQTLARPEVKVDLVVDMIIRWNSTYKMLSHFLKYKSILPIFMDELLSNKSVSAKKRNLLMNLQPTDEEWNILSTLSECLSVFADASEMLSGSSYPSFALRYPILDSIRYYLNTKSNSHMEQVIKSELKNKFKFYMEHSISSEEHKLLLMCAYLDPTAHIMMSPQDNILATELLNIEWNKIEKHDHRSNTNIHSSSSITIASSTPAIASQTSNNTSLFEKLQLFRKKCGFTDDVSAVMLHNNSVLQQELSTFVAYKKDTLTFTSFWLRYEGSLPILSKMARRYGSIPRTSVPSESIFSIAGHVARKIRSSLTAKNLKYSIFLRDKM